MPRHGHLVPRRRVHAGQHQRLPVLGPPHVGERGRGGGVGWTRPGLAPDEEVLVLGVAAVAMDDQSEAVRVVVDEVDYRGRLHPCRLGGRYRREEQRDWVVSRKYKVAPLSEKEKFLGSSLVV